MACQAVGREGRIIHHQERQYHLYSEALKAGSDHALVSAELHYVSNPANPISTNMPFGEEVVQRSPTQLFTEEEFTGVVPLGDGSLKEREVD